MMKSGAKESLFRLLLDDDITETQVEAIEHMLRTKNTECGINSGDGFLDTKSACEYLGNISRTTIWKMRKRGLPCHQLGKRVVYDPKDLRMFVTTNDASCDASANIKQG